MSETVSQAAMRTPREIVARVKDLQPSDPLGFEWTYLAVYVPYAEAKAAGLSADDVDQEKWEADFRAPTAGNIRQSIADYMSFAWEKANDQRGLSASRSVSHMRAWLWLLGDDELVAFIDDEGNYAPYGKPILRRICEKYDLPIIGE